MSDKKRLFGTFGVRRVANEVLTPEFASRLAACYGSVVQGTVAVGGDTRTSSPMLMEAVKAGLLSSGCDVVDLGILPTPGVQYGVRKYYDGGVMITASHNPPKYNGIKFLDELGIGIPDEMELEIEKLYFDEEPKRAHWSEIGQLYHNDKIIDEYIDEAISKVDVEAIKKANLKVVVDCGSGAGSYTAPYLIRKLGCDVTTLNCQADGFFPGRDPEPIEENLQELINVVKQLNADIGLAHDGDADRMITIDENGDISPFDSLLALMSKEFDGDIVTTVDAGLCMDESVKGNVLRTKVGDVNVAEVIIEKDAAFGGEPSGTWLHPDFCMCPDGILSGLRMAELVSNKGKLSELLLEIPSYPNIREKIICSKEAKTAVMENMEDLLKDSFDDIKEINSIDGVRLTFNDDSWVLVRPSGTEDYIRITLESKDSTKAQAIKETCVKIIKENI